MVCLTVALALSFMKNILMHRRRRTSGGGSEETHERVILFRPIWQGASTDSLQTGHPQNGLMAILGVARPQGRRQAAAFYPLGYPMPYRPDSFTRETK
jgi:hypothetical protein